MTLLPYLDLFTRPESISTNANECLKEDHSKNFERNRIGIQQKLKDTGLEGPTATWLVDFILNNQDEYNSMQRRLEFHRSEYGCPPSDRDFYKSESAQAIIDYGSFRLYSQSELIETLGVDEEVSMTFVELTLSTYKWDSGIYWFLLQNDQAKSSHFNLVDHGVDD